MNKAFNMRLKYCEYLGGYVIITDYIAILKFVIGLTHSTASETCSSGIEANGRHLRSDNRPQDRRAD